ncbi:hypothetical protein B0H13DRAFT_1565237, partial [Mycena leptocephala]
IIRKAMTIVNVLKNYFSHRSYGKHHLKEAMKDAEDRGGIEAGGATRFSTFASHASSVLRCLPFMQKCYQSGAIKFDTQGENSDDYVIFRHQLKQVGRLLDPIARGLKTLEGQQVTCSDVFFIRMDLRLHLSVHLATRESFYRDHQAEIYAAFDRRFYIFMNECTPGMFILAYLLDP